MSSPRKKSPVSWWRWLVPVVALVAVFHFSPFGAALDRAFFDASSRRPLRPAPLPDHSALVLIDEATMSALGAQGVRWPFPRPIFAQLIAALHAAGAAHIVVDVTFFEETESDALLAAVATIVPEVTLARTAGRAPIFWSDEFVAAHRAFFAQPRTGLVEFPADADGVARSYVVPDSLAAKALDRPTVEPGGLLRWHGGLEQIRARGVPVLSAAPFIAAGRPIIERLAAAAPELDPETMAKALATEPKLTGETAALVLTRTVFIGANASGTFDLKPLPVGQVEPGVLLHWTAWTNLVAGGFISAVPRSGMLLAALLLAGAVVWPDANVQLSRPRWRPPPDSACCCSPARMLCCPPAGSSRPRPRSPPWC